MPTERENLRRTTEFYESLGFSVAKSTWTEGRGAKLRSYDLFGMFDLLAIGDATTIGLQPTTSNNIQARIKKLWESTYYERWMRCREAHVVGWMWSKRQECWVARVVSMRDTTQEQRFKWLEEDQRALQL